MICLKFWHFVRNSHFLTMLWNIRKTSLHSTSQKFSEILWEFLTFWSTLQNIRMHLIKPTLIEKLLKWNPTSIWNKHYADIREVLQYIAYLLLMRGEINKIAQCVMQLGVGTVDRRVSIYPLELDMSPHHFWQRLGKEKKCTIKWSWECLDWNPMSYQIYVY